MSSSSILPGAADAGLGECVAVGTVTPTSRWLATVAGVMPALEGPEGVAERLLLLVHYGIDWSTGWVARYRATYWERVLPDRVICATYRADTLRRWWRDVANDLGSQPRNAAERQELELLLREESLPVLEALRGESEALLLRVRIVTDAVRTARADRVSSGGPDGGA